MYERGNNVSRAFARKRLRLAERTQCLPPGNDPLNDLDLGGFFTFSYGGENPESTPSLSKTPQSFTRGPNDTIISNTSIKNISCLPILSTAQGICNSVTSAQAGPPSSKTPITINQPPLTQAQKDALNPPTFLSIANAARNAGLINSDPATIPALKITGKTQIPQNNSPSCIPFDGALHCKVDSISLSGGSRTLTVDTTKQPVFLYVEGNITTSGNANIRHVNCGKSETNNCQKNVQPGGSNFTSFDDFQDAVFRFQIRGRAVGGGEQTFKFNGTPSANLLFWAPAATLQLLGTADLSSALFVNKVTANGNTGIRVIRPPDSFNIGLGGGGGSGGGISKAPGKTLTASSTIYTKFFLPPD
jgi:hypothetical protein